MSELDYGPLAQLMQTEDINTIYVNSPQRVYLWHHWDGYKAADVSFNDAAHLAKFAQSLADAAGHKLDGSNPIAEVRLPDGSRALLITAPIATNGAVIQISKQRINDLTLDRLAEMKATSETAAKFLRACVRSRFNIAVVGSYWGGTEGFLNALVDEISEYARIVVIQPIGMLSLKQPDTVILETRKADVNGVGAVTNRHLLEAALGLYPHRIILAELDGTEGAALLNAMDVGYEFVFGMSGSGARDALARLETSAASSNLSVPLLTIREQLARNLDIIVHVELFELGEIALKRMVGIAEVRGMKGDNIDVVQLFERPRDRDELLALGEVSQKLDRIREMGRSEVDEAWFTKTI